MHLLDRAQSRITLIIHIRVQLVCVGGGQQRGLGYAHVQPSGAIATASRACFTSKDVLNGKQRSKQDDVNWQKPQKC